MSANGIEAHQSREDYDRAKGRVNWSSLKHMATSPAHYREQLLRPSGDTDERRLGRAAHLAVFEPETFLERVAVWGGGRRYGKEWDAFKATHAGKELLKEDEHAYCLAIQRAAHTDSLAKKYLRGGRSEVSLFWTYCSPAVGAFDGYEVQCKGRVDFLVPDGAIVDLKTTRNASPQGFGRESWNYRYHAQAAFYVDGHHALTGRMPPYVIVAVETKPPHVVQVYTLSQHLLQRGREEYRELLDRLQLCRRNNSWPGYAETEQDLELPSWVTGYSSGDLADLGINLSSSNAEE